MSDVLSQIASLKLSTEARCSANDFNNWDDAFDYVVTEVRRYVALEGSVPSRSAEEVAKEVAHALLLMVTDDSIGQPEIDRHAAVIAPIIQQAMDGATRDLRDAAADAYAELKNRVPFDGTVPNTMRKLKAALAEQPKGTPATANEQLKTATPAPSTVPGQHNEVG